MPWCAMTRKAEDEQVQGQRHRPPGPSSTSTAPTRFRFSLAAFAAQGRDISSAEERIAGYRNFANKVWNAARFTLMNLEGSIPTEEYRRARLSEGETWILHRLKRVTAEIDRRTATIYRYNEAAMGLYQFTWNEFCDWYLELIKPELDERRPAACAPHPAGPGGVLGTILKLLHPFMPFVTEEIWQKLPGVQGSIMVASFPVPDPVLGNPAAEAEMALVMESIIAVRNMRAEMNVPPSAQVSVLVFSQEPGLLKVLENHQQSVKLQARVQDLQFQPAGDPPAASAKSVVISPEGGSLELVMPLAGLIDFKEEARRLNREMDKLSRELASVQKKLSNEDFLTKARPDVVDKEKERLKTLNEKLTKLKSHEKRLKELLA